MHKNIYPKYKAIICFVVFVAIAANSNAGEMEDAIADVLGKSSTYNIANGSEVEITKHAEALKPAVSSDIERQLAQIEANYKTQIDESSIGQNHDPLNSDLSSHNAKSSGATIVGNIKELTEKNASMRKKIKVTRADELLVAAENLNKATIDDATGMVTIPAVNHDLVKIEDKIVTCREAGDEVVKKCYRARIVKIKQADDLKFETKVYFAANSYAGHYTYVDLKTGKITYSNANSTHSSSRVENSFDVAAPNAQIISIRHIESRWWTEAGVHIHDAHSQVTQPDAANEYVYKSSIEQGSMGRKTKRRENGDKYRGRFEKWEVIARPNPELEESWDDGGCAQLANYAQESFCEGPVTNLLDIGVTRTIAGYPSPVARPYWQEEHIYTCGGGSIVNECQSLHAAGCTQIDSQCIKTKGPFCVEYLQTYNCGKRRITSNLKCDGTKMSINPESNLGSNDGFDVEDFGKAITQMSMVDELKKNIAREGNGSVLLFKGDRLTCDKEWGSDIKNCCNLKGVFKNILGHKCPKEVEEVLAPAVIRERRCVEVAGWQCIAKDMGKCRKWRKSFCCYQSRLARIFQQIAHHQLGISWGSPEKPNCGPLDPHTFSKLNFDEPYAKSLLKELVDEVSVNAQKYASNANQKQVNNDDLNDKVKKLQDRIGTYYQSKATNSENMQ